MPKNSTTEEASTGICSFCHGEFEKKGSSEWSYEEMMPIVNSPRTGVCGYTG